MAPTIGEGGDTLRMTCQKERNTVNLYYDCHTGTYIVGEPNDDVLVVDVSAWDESQWATFEAGSDRQRLDMLEPESPLVYDSTGPVPFPKTGRCQHCERPIVWTLAGWADPQAKGDDSVWRLACDAHDTFTAEHEPKA